MMYMSRLYLNPRSRQVQRELQDAYQMHRTVLKGFPIEMPVGERVLYRLEDDLHGQLVLLVQSHNPPNWQELIDSQKDYLQPPDRLPSGTENPAIKSFELRLKAGQILAFRLRANPTVKKDVEGRKNGRRVGLYKEVEQLSWLNKKLSDAGCRLISVRTSHYDKLTSCLFRHDKKQTLTYFSVQFDGSLEVISPELLEAGVRNGIGSGKGLGFGLLSLAPLKA